MKPRDSKQALVASRPCGDAQLYRALRAGGRLETQPRERCVACGGRARHRPATARSRRARRRRGIATRSSDRRPSSCPVARSRATRPTHSTASARSMTTGNGPRRGERLAQQREPFVLPRPYEPEQRRRTIVGGHVDRKAIAAAAIDDAQRRVERWRTVAEAIHETHTRRGVAPPRVPSCSYQ